MASMFGEIERKKVFCSRLMTINSAGVIEDNLILISVWRLLWIVVEIFLGQREVLRSFVSLCLFKENL
jgi:hypothetical protein